MYMRLLQYNAVHMQETLKCIAEQDALHGNTRGLYIIALKQVATASNAGCSSSGPTGCRACACTTAAAASIEAHFAARLSSLRAHRRMACTMSRGQLIYVDVLEEESVSWLG